MRTAREAAAGAACMGQAAAAVAGGGAPCSRVTGEWLTWAYMSRALPPSPANSRIGRAVCCMLTWRASPAGPPCPICTLHSTTQQLRQHCRCACALLRRCACCCCRPCHPTTHQQHPHALSATRFPFAAALLGPPPFAALAGPWPPWQLMMWHVLSMADARSNATHLEHRAQVRVVMCKRPHTSDLAATLDSRAAGCCARPACKSHLTLN